MPALLPKLNVFPLCCSCCKSVHFQAPLGSYELCNSSPWTCGLAMFEHAMPRSLLSPPPPPPSPTLLSPQAQYFRDRGASVVAVGHPLVAATAAAVRETAARSKQEVR